MSLPPHLRPDMQEKMRGSRSTASTPSLRSSTPNMVDSGGNIKVSVRVRGLLPREVARGAQCLIEMDPETQVTRLLPPNDTDPANARSRNRRVIKEIDFAFDNSFWSHNLEDAHYVSQEDVYDNVGEELVDAAFEGYNTCILAYGQTSSGKSYTMMGTPENQGIIPRTCEDLFQRISENQEGSISYHIAISYYEIYNERVKDLLAATQQGHHAVKEHPSDGFYVDGLTEVEVKSEQEILNYMKIGDARRTTAGTNMNDKSSRSHAVFTIKLKQSCHNKENDTNVERKAKINLVDLAGSENAKATGAQGDRLREGSNINKSLSTLGRVISALATGRNERIPFRESTLTKLLKDSLSGNSKTAMLVCISPSDYEETLASLRYADQAKKIRTKAKVNEDSTSKAERDKRIAEMAEKIRVLERQQLVSDEELHQKAKERLQEYQDTVKQMMRTHEYASEAQQNKMRAIEAENEALKAHLKMTIAELKNPIIVPPPNVAEGAPGVFHTELEDEDTARFWESWEDSVDAEEEERADEAKDLQDLITEWMQQAALFRKKILDDMQRFNLPSTQYLTVPHEVAV